MLDTTVLYNISLERLLCVASDGQVFDKVKFWYFVGFLQRFGFGIKLSNVKQLN